eukprot:TRINITY_DN626_c1_g1_i1.p1 TRINITY_DN626_c1_g1~~TRINITY_DN626_c1_g1_i1.p1  ORF type:complete len:338 (+),score=102.31 TRINITY_DN626_c1_g1_i1:39-1016(+)
MLRTLACALLLGCAAAMHHPTSLASKSYAGNYLRLELQHDKKSMMWTIHGLWPQWEEWCHDETFDLAALDPIIPKLEEYWPSKYSDDSEFWSHEWNRHGSCAEPVDEQLKFFTTVLTLYSQSVAECPSTGGECFFCFARDTLERCSCEDKAPGDCPKLSNQDTVLKSIDADAEAEDVSLQARPKPYAGNYYRLELQLEKGSLWTIHGLWPQWTEYCGGEKFDVSLLEPILPKLEEYWPSNKCTDGSCDAKFWEHEWDRHGSCAENRDELNFFSTALDLYKQHVGECPSSGSKCFFCFAKGTMDRCACEDKTPGDCPKLAETEDEM